ncbi:MAG: coenzyme F420 hydrogenase/dehydrogenase beta subunit N-terminal domain-containing protein [bacterium]
MVDTPLGPAPDFPPDMADVPDLAWNACPGKGIHYPDLYRKHYGALPASWLLGHVKKVRTGYAADPDIRRRGASGGVISRVLIHLLETKRIDGAIVVQQGLPVPEKARVKIARTCEEILAAAESIYVPVSVLDILRDIKPGERYAMTCLPDQSSALRLLQVSEFQPAQQVKYVLGPYTGTALYPAAIRCFLRAKRVKDDDAITSLKWRAGEWPGYLEIKTASGKVLMSKKVYYNFLIPFFVTQNSLQNMDFANEFCDLSVGDAWSPKFESQSGGHSVITTRSDAMEDIIADMVRTGLLAAEEVDPLDASAMHGHMLDFKKRGGYIRNRLRRCFGRAAPDFGMKPQPLPVSRVAVELVISSIFLLSRTWLARKIVEQIPEEIIGPVFNKLRLGWKSLSKPTKRKGLRDLKMEETTNGHKRARTARSTEHT